MLTLGCYHHHHHTEMALTTLTYFNFEADGRTGTIPTEFFAIPVLHAIRMFSLLLFAFALLILDPLHCFSLGIDFDNLTSLMIRLVIDDNQLEGTVPTEFAMNFVPSGPDRQLFLGPNNFIHPTFPTEFLSIQNISQMYVDAA